jgi:integrase
MGALLTMVAAVEDYLAVRRKLGFALHIEGQELGRFARFADEVGHTGPITTAIAVRWATLPADASRLYHARRLDLVRRLSRFRAAFEPETEIPPEGLLGPSYSRREPHVYWDSEITELLSAASQLGPTGGLRPCTYVTLFGLLACTGLRISEALALTRSHVDLDAGVITIAAGKFRRERLVPVHPTTAQALRDYAARRDRYCRTPRAETFFISEFGTSLKYQKVLGTFATLRRQLGWTVGRGARRPRIHDLRHTLIVRRLLRWYEDGSDIDRKIATLSIYVGHVKVSNTYWYLTAIPELLAVGAARFEKFAATRSQIGGRS